ncbi:hypothetical protein EK21DRAFT_71664 [Setomelanomma holmii]|uniref:WDR59/RTC1-like RING zinc finger domain-containing protein n=1 Tax=Setomelanomma holmii TaxID=210430 RepID=A0A9P4H3V5_9PLEO|nr:hypothetical protein EK21DRAFT_71664 [Setomelanomma holmii]
MALALALAWGSSPQHHHQPKMAGAAGPSSAFESSTFEQTASVAVDDEIGSASISPSGRDVVLASQSGLRIIDLDNLYSLPLYIPNHFSWKVADVQWSPFAARAEWIASTRNQQALVYNLAMPFNNKKAPIEFTLRAHDRAITDINFSAHHPDLLATCGMDSFVFVHDLRTQQASLKLADWEAGAHQVKWNRQDDKIIASSHDKYLHIWDTRHGTRPLSTIAAHSTKIYGIDWNRSDPKKILTCSLDHTIKLWNNVGVNANITTPRLVIRTRYPVWRARHTPFPHGILAMPQRGNSSLWLYKHVNDSVEETFDDKAVHEFEGHAPDAQVREFLWRSRGSTDDGIDNRDFQLVSWGTDNHLRLHKITSELLEASVGYRKGQPLVEEPSTTRKGAAYVTYRDGPVQTTTSTVRNEYGPPRSQQKGNLSTLLHNFSLKDDSYLSDRGRQAQPQLFIDSIPRETMTATPIRRTDPFVVTHMTWMEGVKVGDGHDNASDSPSRPDRERGKSKHPYQERNDLGAEISAVGNKYKKLTFESIDVPGRRITVSFNGPWGEYDNEAGDHKLVFLRLTIKFPAGYPKAFERTQVGRDWVQTGKPLEIEFERTTATISQDSQEELTDNMSTIAETCADQQRGALEAVLSYALGERGLTDSLHLDDDQPLEDFGPLPGEESSSDDEESPEGEFTNDVMQSSHTNANVPTPNQCSARFSAFGTLVVARIPISKSATAGLDGGIHFRMDRGLRHGLGKDDIFDAFGRFTAPRGHDSDGDSSPSSSDGSWAASSSGSSSSDPERMTKVHIAQFQPPWAWPRAAVLVLARRALVRIKRKDSGLDLQFDKADTVTNPRLTGRVKWGNHVVVTWLIPALFDHFERLADTQMLAMLSCIFAEPAAREGVTSTMSKMRHSHLPMSMEAPAFSLDYFSSADAAWSLFKPTISVPTTPAYSRYATPVNDFRSSKSLDTYGSHGSSNGPWGSDTAPSEPVTPYSTDHTPPLLSRASTVRTAHTSSHTPLAPSRSRHNKRASFGQSDRVNVSHIYDSDSDYERIDEEDIGTNDGASEYTRPITPGESDGGDGQGTIKVKLKNQDQFDDEACVSKPLLDMSKDWLHRAWREQYAEMLGCWGLVSARAEVLKFNGLISYFPTEVPRGSLKADSAYLAIRNGSNVVSDTAASGHLSRASSTLVPPSPRSAQPKRSPISSPKTFALNPEAQEFQPSTTATQTVETFAPMPDVFIATEQYLQLSIPVPTPSKELDESVAGLGTSPRQRSLHPNHGGRSSRPSLSRGASNVSGTSLWGPGRSPSTVPTTTPSKPTISEPIYSCCICWIRVSGRFYLCPACLHMAHFDCMDDELGMDDGECVVGCGCGCGIEDNDERSRMEAYIDEVRAANAAGVGWDESSVWAESAPATPALYTDNSYGDFMTGAASKIDGGDVRRERDKERVGAGRGSKTTSPTPTTSTMRKKKEKKKKSRVSGLSYY